jgi:hypothetical protein
MGCFLGEKNEVHRKRIQDDNLAWKLWDGQCHVGLRIRRENFVKKSWELMGKPNLVWSPIKLRISKQYIIYLIGRLEQVEVNINGVKTKTNFEVIEIIDDSD